MRFEIEERLLHFKQPAGTSRGVYTTRKIWLVHLSDGLREGVGECAPLPDLSCDARPDYGEVLEGFCQSLCETGEIDYEALRTYPSMLFGLETALLNLQQGDQLFDTAFSRGEVGIPINGLVWMGSYEEMLKRMEEKLEKGFRCVKLKIGAIDFDQELDLVKRIRERFSFHEVELRLDANGAFPFEEVLYKLELLSQYAIHSIEQGRTVGLYGRALPGVAVAHCPRRGTDRRERSGDEGPYAEYHQAPLYHPETFVARWYDGLQGVDRGSKATGYRVVDYFRSGE